jgi:hypothetical protein
MEIKTDHKWRPFIYGHELTEKEKKELDYYDWNDENADCHSGVFFRYRGWTYDLSQILRVDMDGWDGAESQTYSSGILVKVSKDGEYYKVGRYF